MLRNYLTVAWRNLWKSKIFSTINIFGLAVGMTVCLLVLTLIYDQNQRDEHHRHADHIYRVTSTSPELGRYATSPGPVGPALERSAPGIEAVVRIRQERLSIIHRNEVFSFRGLYAERPFFEIFDFPLAAGNPATALENPYSIVLSQEMAQKAFGRVDPVGETVTVETNPFSGSSEEVGAFTVTGVLEETETDSHLSADAYLSFSTLSSATNAAEPDNWSNRSAGSIFSYFTYLLLSDETRAADVESRMSRMIEPHSDRDSYTYSLGLQPLVDIHLGPQLINELNRSGILAANMVYFLGGLALLILLAAGFNYANLSVARSLTRTREIGVRKTMGAGRGQVAAQFLSESVLMALLALPIAFALLQGLIPIFNMQQYANLFQTSLTLEAIEQPSVILLFIGFAMIVGVLAGAYPALHLSKFDPVTVLSKAGTGRGGSSSSLGVRRGLTVLQFGMALFFTVSAVLLYRQANHAARADYGFNTERLLYVNLQDAPPQAFKQQAQQLRGVESVSMTSKVPVISGVGGVGAGMLRRVNEKVDSTNSGIRTQDHVVGSQFVENMGVRMAAAVDQMKMAFTEGSSIIINKEAVHDLGFGSPAEAIGEIVSYGDENLRIVGVVDGYWYLNPYTYITPDGRPNPLVLRHDAEQFQYALIRTRSGAMDDAISRLQDLWTNFDSLHPLDYGIYEEALQRTTAPMVEGAKLIGLAALLAVLIASVGLLGIASYNVRTRTQEIGIRKALGASVRDVVWLLSKQYLWLVLGAGVIALPLANWINSQWLADYAHRIEIGWWTPGLSFAALVMLVLAVVGTQTVRAALTNPTESLRDE